MLRTCLAILLATTFASTAAADVLVVKKRGKPVVLGMPRKVGSTKIKITPDNWRIYAEKSYGVIEIDSYDGVTFKSKAKGRAAFYPIATVLAKAFTTEPGDLLDAYDHMSTGSYIQAIGLLRKVKDDESVRPVYRLEAYFQAAIAYLRVGNRKNAAGYLRQWPGKKSIYTPEAYRIMAEIRTEQKAYSKALAFYKQIEDLPDITKEWSYKARLGAVKVAIERRKFADAESDAKRLASEIGTAADMTDVRTLADCLHARAIFRSENKDRYPEAQRILEAASKLENVTSSSAALLYSTLGDILYAQGKPEEARFPYMRVVCMYPDESSYVANALQNAGNCLLDLRDRTKSEAEADEHLVAGMKLLAECAGRHRGTSAARAAATRYRKLKPEYEAVLARTRGATAGDPGGK